MVRPKPVPPDGRWLRGRPNLQRCGGEQLQAQVFYLFRPDLIVPSPYKVRLKMEEWMRQRVRLYYWKQWKQPHATTSFDRTGNRSRGGQTGLPRPERLLAGMSSHSLVQRALNNQWLRKQGVPDIRIQWIKLHYGLRARVESEPPGADPPAGRCGARSLIAPGDPIGQVATHGFVPLAAVTRGFPDCMVSVVSQMRTQSCCCRSDSYTKTGTSFLHFHEALA